MLNQLYRVSKDLSRVADNKNRKIPLPMRNVPPFLLLSRFSRPPPIKPEQRKGATLRSGTFAAATSLPAGGVASRRPERFADISPRNGDQRFAAGPRPGKPPGADYFLFFLITFKQSLPRVFSPAASAPRTAPGSAIAVRRTWRGRDRCVPRSSDRPRPPPPPPAPAAE